MADPPDALAALRDIRPPLGLPPSLAGDLAAAALLGMAAALGVALLAALLVRRRRTRALRAARAALRAGRTLPAPERLAVQAAVLRRLVRTLQGDEAAREQAAPWLARLDALLGTRFFTTGAGQAFGGAIYAPGQADPARIEAGLDRLLAGKRG